MKRFSKIFAIALVLTLIFASLPAAFAAGTEPGKTATVSFSFQGIYGVDGSFSFSNKGIFSSVSYGNNGTMAGTVNNDIAFFYSSAATNFTINVTVQVADSAKNGDSCDITFNYRTSDANGNMSEWKSATKTVTVEVHDCKDGNKDHKCDTCGKKLSDCADANNTHKCDVCGATLSKCKDSNKDNKCDICGVTIGKPIDYTELDKQIKNADELKQTEYTQESWDALTKAYETAKDARKNGNQNQVDAAAKALAEAIGKLVKMDYSKLEAALEAAKKVGNENFASLIERLVAAVDAADKALKGNDQAAVDAATAELEKVTADLEKALAEMKTTEIQTVEKEVFVEVEPSGPFCNISWHNLLVILLVVSVVANVVLIVVIIVSKKKK